MAEPDNHAKLLKMIEALDSGEGNRKETIALLAETAERLKALEISNKRMREETRGAAQIAWTQFMASAIQGHLTHEMIALDFQHEHQWQALYDNCEQIADEALLRWKMRWIDGIARRPRKPRAAEVDPLPKPGEIVSGDKIRQDMETLFGPEPTGRSIRMVDASAPTKPAAPAKTEAPAPPAPKAPEPTAATAPKVDPPKPQAPTPAPAAPKVDLPPKPSPPAPQPPKERQPGDD
jgi:hypothetical protein